MATKTAGVTPVRPARAPTSRSLIKENPSNPTILGADLEDVLWQAAGLAVTGFINDKSFAPMIKTIVPGQMTANNMIAKAVDAGSTFLAAYVLDKGVEMIGPDEWGRNMGRGGYVLAGGKLISAIVPGYAITATLPNLPVFGAWGSLPAGAPQTPVIAGRRATDTTPVVINNPPHLACRPRKESRSINDGH